MKWILIASAIVIGLLVIFILYDQRKNIFKKRVKKAKEPKQEAPKAPEKPKEEPKVLEEKKTDVSLEERAPQIKKETKQPIIEDMVIQDDDYVEYDSTMPRQSGFGRRNINQRKYAPPPEFKFNKKQPIKEQIKDLSPEMKAILFGNLLDKKDD